MIPDAPGGSWALYSPMVEINDGKRSFSKYAELEGGVCASARVLCQVEKRLVISVKTASHALFGDLNMGTQDTKENPAGTAPASKDSESLAYGVGQGEGCALDRPVCVVFRDVSPDAKPVLSIRKKVSHSPGM